MVKNNYIKIATGTTTSYDRGYKEWKINISPDFTPSRVVVFITQLQFTTSGYDTDNIKKVFTVCDSDNPDLNYPISHTDGASYVFIVDKFNRKEINLKTKQNYYNYLKIWVTWLAIE